VTDQRATLDHGDAASFLLIVDRMDDALDAVDQSYMGRRQLLAQEKFGDLIGDSRSTGIARSLAQADFSIAGLASYHATLVYYASGGSVDENQPRPNVRHP
jgi:hypothetical protein